MNTVSWKTNIEEQNINDNTYLLQLLVTLDFNDALRF